MLKGADPDGDDLDDDDPDDEPKPKKAKLTDSYGCVKWSPPMPKDETEVSLAEKCSHLRKLYCSLEHTPEIEALLSQTYYCQRKDINNGMQTQDLLLWPMLFQKVGLLQHFFMLTAIKIEETMVNSLMGKQRDLWNFLRSSKSHKDFFATVCEPATENTFLLILAIAHHFQEDASQMFYATQEVFTPRDISCLHVRNTPSLIGNNVTFYKSSEFMLVIDGVVVNSNIQDSLSALCMLMALFYVFNIHYPHALSITLEFIQRCLIGINPAGNKTERAKATKVKCINPRLLTFCKGLREFSSRWLNIME